MLSIRRRNLLIGGLVVAAAIALAVALYWPRADALAAALEPLIKQDSDQSRVARAILDNYIETRSNASVWSGVYWSFTFCAAIFSALAGLLLKFESIIKNEGLRKDTAALLSVSAALLITISTSGDFQRKWQANRVAASKLERAAYELLENRIADPHKHFATIGNILHERNLAVVGNLDRKAETAPQAGKSAADE